MTDITHLLWLDLETTGTDENEDQIIEIGVVLTDLELAEIDRYESVVGVYEKVHELLTRTEDRFVLNMHQDNGLLDTLAAGIGRHRAAAEGDVLRMLHTHEVGSHTVALAGSGVGHFDRRFLAVHMPALDKHLAYPVLDIGTIRRAIQWWAPGWVPDQDGAKPHRALDDVQIHLDDARAYRAAFITAKDDQETHHAG